MWGWAQPMKKWEENEETINNQSNMGVSAGVETPLVEIMWPPTAKSNPG